MAAVSFYSHDEQTPVGKLPMEASYLMVYLSKFILIGECIALLSNTVHGHSESHLEIHVPLEHIKFVYATNVGSGHYTTPLQTN